MRKPKITFGEMREMGVRGLLVYCSDYHCSHWTAISGDQWPMISGYPTSSRASPARTLHLLGVLVIDLHQLVVCPPLDFQQFIKLCVKGLGITMFGSLDNERHALGAACTAFAPSDTRSGAVRGCRLIHSGSRVVTVGRLNQRWL